jgi:hypothetical protein
VELFEVGIGEWLQGCCPHLSLRHESAELLAARLHVLDFGAVVRRAVERRPMQFVVGDGNPEA